jgi:uncharacterized protein
MTPLSVPHNSWYSPKIAVRTSPIHGIGTFAVEPIARGEVVEVWGEHADGEQVVSYTSDSDAVRKAEREGMAVMQWDDDLYSIEEQGADTGYFLNHSCDSNLGFGDAFTLIGRRPIEPGEELTLDYVLFETDELFVASWQCGCGDDSCRQTPRGTDWRRPDLQDRYSGLFTPILAKRIARLAGPGLGSPTT